MENNYQQIIANLKDALNSIENHKFVGEIKNKDVAIFLGNTKSGKSTTVNYFLGNRLKVTEPKTGLYRLEKETAENGPDVGQETTSLTTNPTVWKSPYFDFLLVDAPGFDDNRGASQDILNAFYIKNIMLFAKTLKIILVSDIKDIISDNVGRFIDLMDKMHTIFPIENHSLLKGVSIIFNKDSESNTVGDIKELLFKSILMNESIDIRNKNLIRHFVEDDNCVGILRTPSGVNEIKSVNSKDLEIVYDTSQIHIKYLSDINPGISNKSYIFLLDAYNDLTTSSEMEELLIAIEINYSKVLTEYKTLSYEKCSNQLSKFIENIKDISTNTDLDFIATLFTISEMNSNILSSDLYRKLEEKHIFISFLDGILKINQRCIMLFHLKQTLLNMFVRTREEMLSLSVENNALIASEAEQKLFNIKNEAERVSVSLQDQVQNLKSSQRIFVEKQKSNSDASSFACVLDNTVRVAAENIPPIINLITLVVEGLTKFMIMFRN